jgi:hypothetical protein
MTTSPLRLFSDRAASTLAGGISPTSVTLNLTAGGGALFPNPNAPNFFAATLIDAATGLLDEIVWCTARTADTLTVIRAQEGTDALTFNAGDLFQKLLTSGDMGAMLQSNQLFVPSTTFFVNGATGLDTNTGTSATVVAGTNIGPFQTLQGAANTIRQFFSSATVTLNVATGTGTYAGVNIGPSLIAAWILNGSGASVCNIVQSGAGTSAGRGLNIQSTSVTLSGFKISAQFDGILAQNGSIVNINNCNFGACSGGAYANSAAGSEILLTGSITGSGTSLACSISQSGGLVAYAANNGFVSQPLALTFSGAAFAGATVAITSGGTALFLPSGITFSGIPTATRFTLQFGEINTQGSGLSYIPGTAAGVFTPLPTTSGAASTISSGLYL